MPGNRKTSFAPKPHNFWKAAAWPEITAEVTLRGAAQCKLKINLTLGANALREQAALALRKFRDPAKICAKCTAGRVPSPQ
jgi:hypothetical protein